MYDKYDDSNSEKQRIFNIATRLMDKIGYEKLSIRQICTEAGILIPTTRLWTLPYGAILL